MANIHTPEFRVSYPNVFTARLNDLNGKHEFSVVAVFKKGEDLSKLMAACKEVMVKKWGADQTKWPKNLRSPFKDQSERQKDGKIIDGYEAGAIFINFKSMQQPGVVDVAVQPIIEPKDFYAGCWAIATVAPYAYDMKVNKGVAFGLRNLQKTRDGDPMGGRTRPEDDFQPIAGSDSGANASGTPETTDNIFG